jgi:hypothetical protein
MPAIASVRRGVFAARLYLHAHFVDRRGEPADLAASAGCAIGGVFGPRRTPSGSSSTKRTGSTGTKLERLGVSYTAETGSFSMLESGDYAKALSNFDGGASRGEPTLPGSETGRRQHPLVRTASQKAEGKTQAEALARALQTPSRSLPLQPEPFASRPRRGQFTSADAGGETQSSARASGVTAQALAPGFPNA